MFLNLPTKEETWYPGFQLTQTSWKENLTCILPNLFGKFFWVNTSQRGNDIKYLSVNKERSVIKLALH